MLAKITKQGAISNCECEKIDFDLEFKVEGRINVRSFESYIDLYEQDLNILS